jgi:hypothetical protein
MYATADGCVPTNSDIDYGSLAASVQGTVYMPGDPDFEGRAAGWNVAVRREPVAVVEVSSAGDVSAAVSFAGLNGLKVVVQSTGHGATPLDVPFLLITTRLLDECVVHPDGWARVGAGVRWDRVIAAAAEHGLAPLAGSAPHVGVIGYLTGGGLGPVARTFGVASDRIRAIELVSGDGQARRVTAEDNSGLFWGLRGGKGALGVVTSVEFDLVQMSTLYGGALYFDGADARQVLETWRTWSAALPEEATTSIAFLQLPDAPFVPAPLAGHLTVAVRYAWTGDPREGERHVAAMREAGAVVFGAIDAMPYTALGSIHADPVEPMPVFERIGLLRELGDEVTEILVAGAGPGSGSPQVIVEVRQLGGAIARSAIPSALCHRDAGYSILTIGIDAPGIGEATRGHSEGLLEALEPWLTGGKLPNFAPEQSAAAIRRTYDDDTLGRLGRLVAVYDPRSVIADAAPILEACAQS